MVLLDRSKLRLKAATAKLKKQRQCNMSRENSQTEPRSATKRHKTHKNWLRRRALSSLRPGLTARFSQKILICAFCAFLWLLQWYIAANVKSKNPDPRRRRRGNFYGPRASRIGRRNAR